MNLKSLQNHLQNHIGLFFNNFFNIIFLKSCFFRAYFWIKKITLFGYFWLFLAFFYPLQAQDTIKLYNTSKMYEVGYQTSFFEDESEKLAFEEIEKKPFQKINGRTFKHPLTINPIWFRIVVQNPTSEERDWIFSFQKTEIYEAHLYYRDIHGKKHDEVSGLHYYPHEKSHLSAGVCFPINIPAKTTYIFYVKTLNPSFLTYVPTFIPQKIYEQNLYYFYMAIGLFYGLVSMVLAYNFLGYYNTGKKFYFYLTISILSFIILTSCYDGIFFNFFPQVVFVMGGFQSLVFSGLFMLSFAKFLEKYFIFKANNHKILYYHTQVLFIIGIVLMLFGFLRLVFGYQLFLYILPYTIWTIAQIIVFVWKSPIHAEKYFFIIGLGLFFFSIFISILSNEQIIAVSTFTRSALHWGFCAFVLSISLGLQFQAQEKGIKMRKQEIETQKNIANQNIALQQEVINRTQELAQKELNIRGVIESTHDLIYALDKNFNILVFNSAAEKNAKTNYGVLLEIGKNYVDLMPYEIKKLMEKPLNDALIGKRPIFVQQNMQVQQRRVFRDIFLNPIFDDNNEVVGLSIFSKDVTQSSITRKELQYSQSFLQTVFDNSPDALFLVNQNNYLIEKCNKTAIKMFEAISEHEFVGRKGSFFHQDLITEEEKVIIKKSINQTGQWEGEYLYKTRKGKAFWGNIILTVFELQNKTYQLARITDITQKKQIEQDLKSINQKILSEQANLTALLENNDFAIWLVDDKGVFVNGNNLYNTLYLECFGYVSPRHESLAYGFPKHEKILWTRRFREILAGQEGYYLEKRAVKGKIRHFSIKAFPVKHGQQVIGASFFAQDISLSIYRDRKLKRKNKTLKKLNSELDKFVYRASHDLRAPLSSILGLINVANMENKNKEMENYLSLMEKSVRKLDHFIQQIVHYSRNVRVSLKPEIINLPQILAKIFENLQFMPQASCVVPQIYINFGEMAAVTDVFRLEVILNNLISNAYRYANTSQEMPFVKVTAFVENNFIHIEIQDNGQGIDEIHLPKIFEMFYKATDQNVGTGLGLYIVKEAIEVLKGTIKVQSVLRKGTTFFVKIPNLSLPL